MKTMLRLLAVCLAASLFFTACSQPPTTPSPTAVPATVSPASPTAVATDTAVPPTPTPVPTETAVPPAPTDTPVPGETANIIFYNGRILTMNPTQPTAQAIAIRGDAILAVGSSDEILAYQGKDTQAVDLEGLTITPGFIDSHAHRIGDRWHFGDVSAEQILDEALSQGWTSIHEMFVTDERLAELQAMADADALPVRVSMYLTMNFEYDATDWWQAYQPLQQFGPYLQIAGLKITLDREWGEQIFFSPEQYNELVLAGTEAGWQIATHSFSPAANAIVLDGYGAALNGQSNDTLRLRLEHTGTMTDGEVRQMAELGVIGAVQLSAVSWVDDASFKKYIPAEEVEHTARWRDMLDAGIFLIGNTDSPWCCTDWRNDFQRPPYQATTVRTLYQGVTRTGFGGRQPEPWQLAQALTVQEALEMLTMNGAYAAHQEDVIGSLEAGKLADMVILSANPLEIPVEQIADIQVNMTMVGGQVRFCGEGQDRLCPQAGAVSPTETPPAAEAADLIFYNGRILTLEPDQPTAQAIAIREQKITAVGSDITILALKGPATQVIDLHGLTLMPGIIDAHSHLFNDAGSAGLDLDQAQQLALENGITSFADMYVTEDFLQEMQAYEQQGKLRLRTSLYLVYTDPCGVVQGDWYKAYPPTRNPGEMLRIGGVKIFADGGVCGKAALSTGYPDGGYGDLWFTQDELNRAVAEAQNAGYQVAIHAQGDLAIEQAQNAIESALGGQPNTFRHRIEHNPFARPDLLPRYSEIGIVPIAWGEYPTCSEVNDAYYSSYFGAEPMPWLENWRAFLDANPNLPAAWHTDFPYAAINPFLHLYSYVTRQEVDADGTVCLPPDWLAAHRITVDEALPMMTINGAYALFRDEEVGSLKARKYADLIIISDDPTTIDPNDLINIQVQMTMVGGQTAFCAEGQADLCPQGGTAVPPAATPTPPPAAAPGITASAFLATDPPENAFDGSPDTAWISGGDAPQWIAIDLGEPTAVSGIRLTVAMYPDGRTTHRVYGKTPDGDYQLLHEFQGDTVDGQVLSYIPPEPWADIQFIKVETTATPSWVAWKEIVIETP